MESSSDCFNCYAEKDNDGELVMVEEANVAISEAVLAERRQVLRIVSCLRKEFDKSMDVNQYEAFAAAVYKTLMAR